MTHDYVAQKDQFLLTILPFNKRSGFARIILSYVILCMLDVNNISCSQLWEGTDNKDDIRKSFGYVTGLKNNSFNAIMVFKTNVTRSQRNGKDKANMNYCRWVAG